MSHNNGAALLLAEYREITEGKRKPTARELGHLQLRATMYILDAIPPLREAQARLEKHDVIQWGLDRPKISFIIFLFYLAITFSVPRKYILQAAWHLWTGVTLPLDTFW